MTTPTKCKTFYYGWKLLLSAKPSTMDDNSYYGWKLPLLLPASTTADTYCYCWHLLLLFRNLLTITARILLLLLLRMVPPDYYLLSLPPVWLVARGCWRRRSGQSKEYAWDRGGLKNGCLHGAQHADTGYNSGVTFVCSVLHDFWNYKHIFRQKNL